MADVKQKRFMVQEMTIILWNRMIIYWLMDYMKQLYQKMFGMEFKLPIIKEDMKLRLDNDSHIE